MRRRDDLEVDGDRAHELDIEIARAAKRGQQASTRDESPFQPPEAVRRLLAHRARFEARKRKR